MHTIDNNNNINNRNPSQTDLTDHDRSIIMTKSHFPIYSPPPTIYNSLGWGSWGWGWPSGMTAQKHNNDNHNRTCFPSTDSPPKKLIRADRERNDYKTSYVLHTPRGDFPIKSNQICTPELVDHRRSDRRKIRNKRNHHEKVASSSSSVPWRVLLAWTWERADFE